MFVGIGLGIGRQRFSGGGGFVGLLDLYPSASVAYSLRRLSSTYTGNAIRVRRASDNTEQNIGFDALGNLDTTALTTFCSGTNGFVTTWYDQSGNGRNRTQSTASNQPQIVSSGSVILDGTKPAILNNANSTLSSTSFIVSQPSTKFIVAKSTQPVNNRVLSGSLDNNKRHQVGWNASSSQVYSLFAGTLALSTTTNMTYVRALVFGMFNGANSQIGVNGGSAVTVNPGTQDNDGINTGVPPFSFDGTIQEEIYYPFNQSSNRNDIQSNINDYYAIY